LGVGDDNGLQREWLQREEVTREWRKYHHRELHDLSLSPNIIQVMKAVMRRWGELQVLGEK
jgi:hypothetical protein